MLTSFLWTGKPNRHSLRNIIVLYLADHFFSLLQCEFTIETTGPSILQLGEWYVHTAGCPICWGNHDVTMLLGNGSTCYGKGKTTLIVIFYDFGCTKRPYWSFVWSAIALYYYFCTIPQVYVFSLILRRSMYRFGFMSTLNWWGERDSSMEEVLRHPKVPESLRSR